jgi:uncharacterized membrane protein YkvA (DUF1232 family)
VGQILKVRLSFADRDNLLEAMRGLSEDVVDVEHLLRMVGDWARTIKPQFGFEHVLLRNLTQLSNYLRLYQGNDDLAAIARGALQFVVRDDGQAEASGDVTEKSLNDRDEFRSLGRAFIASYAVHEIAVRLGEAVAYHPPSITREEKAQAEVIFERLSEIDGCEVELLDRVAKHLADIRDLASCGFLNRLEANVLSLVNILKDPSWPASEKAFVRGALRYFVEDEDLINGKLGLVGFLDDIFIIQMAVDLVSPTREPLIELLDKVIGVWPFLNMLTLDDGSGPRPASEFTIINSALSCSTLRSEDAFSTLLIAPETGPITVLLGFVSTLGLAHDAGARQLTEKSFSVGQKVLVDYEAVATFEGFEEMEDGRRLFRLRKNRTERGQKGLGSITSWPIADLYRLVPIAPDRVARGEIDWRARNKATPVEALDFLFSGLKKVDVHSITKQVIVVMPTTIASDFCRSTELYGQSIRDVIPLGQIASDGETTESWSPRFGMQKPVLLFVSDLDVARSYAEENREQIELVVVDIAGRNREKHASLKRLKRLNIPCLMVASERIANETEIDQYEGLAVWEWSPEDLNALVWPELKPEQTAGQIASFERRIRSTSLARPIVESVALPIVSETYRAFRALRRLSHLRGAERLPELDEVLTESFYATTRLMRTASPLTESSSSVSEVRQKLMRIESLTVSSNFLSDKERDASHLLRSRIAELAEQLQEHNPKADALRRLTSSSTDPVILCPDARLVSELAATFAGKANKVVVSVCNDTDLSGGVIIPGWFRQNRMATLLSPPIANPLTLILYDVERRWHQQFSEKQRGMRLERSQLKGKSSIFPSMNGWKAPRPSILPSPSFVDEEVIDDVDEVEREINDGLQSRILTRIGAHGSDADVKARLVVFVGNAYGLFTDNYRLNVVTHLLNGSVADDDENASVKIVAAKDVEVGDAIVFRPRSRDLIREVADELLEPGQRELSRSWQKSLREFVANNALADEIVYSRLRQAGCKSGPQAMQNWLYDEDMIAPQQFKTDIAAIAQVTGDVDLLNGIESVIDAIKEVRSCHQQKAPRLIARRIREKAATVVREEQFDQAIVHLEGDLILARVLRQASELIPVTYAIANRIREDDSWLE